MSNPIDGFQVTPGPIQQTTEEIAKAAEPGADNLVMAENMAKAMFRPFCEGVDKASNKQLRRLMKLLVQFPFIDKNKLTKKTLPTNEEKTLFMLGERLIHANMVRRANAELKRTFDEVAKEETAETVVEEKTDV
jgi:hypothetical protein